MEVSLDMLVVDETEVEQQDMNEDRTSIIESAEMNS
jgi:hypothetical protein